MSTKGNAVKGAASAAADQAEAPKPLIAPTGNATLGVLTGDINDAHAASQRLSDPKATDLDKANAVIGESLNAIMLPVTLLNDGFALATRDIGKLIELPAATLLTPHLGIPHVHLHPPAMPIPLPSFGVVAAAGCASVLINGIPAARAGDVGIATGCGTYSPVFEVFTGSSKVFFGGARAARMLDITMHCMPGAGAAKAMATLMKAASVGMGVVGVGAGVLDTVTKAERAKKVERKPIDPGEAAKMTPEELAAAQEAAEAAAAEEPQDNLEEAAAEEAAANTTGIQAGLDAAALALSMLKGLDPGTPPCIGALLTGHPNVLIGGFPMPPWSAVARGLAKLGKSKGKKRKSKQPLDKGKRSGHPIDPITGANEDEFNDYEEPVPVGFRWDRNYTSADADREGQMGRGFRHGYEHRLKVDLDQVTYTNARGQAVEIPLPRSAKDTILLRGYILRVRDDADAVIYELERPAGPTMQFVRARRAGAGSELSLARMHTADVQMRFLYDDLGRLRGIDETSRSAAIETRFALDDRGHIVEVRRGPRGQRDLPLIAAYGYDHAGRLTVFQDAIGAKSRYTYDAAHRIVRMTDRNGHSFHFAYDDQGRCTEEHGDGGLWRVALRYEPENRRTLVTRADGGEWVYEYDENQTLTSIHDPYGGKRRLVTDEEGKITSEVGADGGTVWNFLYDIAGYNYGLADRFGRFHPPLDVEPNPPPPPAHRVPSTARAQQWGEAGGMPAAVNGWRHALPDPVQSFLAALPSDAGAQGRPSQRRDRLGRAIEETDAAGRRRSWGYDPNGNAVRFVDRDGREHRVESASWNLVGATIDPLGHRTCVEYTAHERVACVVDPGGSEVRYDYDLKDRLVRVTCHGVVRDEYSYDIGDRLVEKRDASGDLLVRCASDGNGLPSEYTLASGEVFRYRYTDQGDVTRASTREVEVLRDFDARQRLLFDERDGRGVRHRYAGGALAETTYLGRFTVLYGADPGGTLRIRAPVGGEHRIRQDRSLVLLELGNETSVISSYDEENRCTGRAAWRKRGTSTALWSVRYTYSAEGELLRVDDNHAGVTHHIYDAAHRLVGERGPDGTTSAIAVDAAGNVREKHGLRRTEVLDGNRLLSAGRERFTYDQRDRLASWTDEAGEVTQYQYNSIDMLVRVSWSVRAEEWTAGYDGIGRRLWKALGAARTEYFWDGERLAAEIGPTGAVRIYIYAGREALVPMMFIDYASMDADPGSGRAYYPIGNQLGVPLHIEDEAGNIVWRARRVEPYGTVVVHPGASIAYALRFPGHYLDEETGHHYNRFRYYSPRLGRYLQPDPAGQAGGVNLYAYPANPLAHVDVLGLVHTQQEWDNFVASCYVANPPIAQPPDFIRFLTSSNAQTQFDPLAVDAERSRLERAHARYWIRAYRASRHLPPPLNPLPHGHYTRPENVTREDATTNDDKAVTYFYTQALANGNHLHSPTSYPLGENERRPALLLNLDGERYAFLHAIADQHASSVQIGGPSGSTGLPAQWSGSDHAAMLYTTPTGRRLLVWNAQDWKDADGITEANLRTGTVLQEMLLAHRPDVVVLLETGVASRENKFLQWFIEEISAPPP
ncbi:RHS repeat-associated core domain-containing protein [Sorangium sp. So ce887]|uniref:RHS repeat-associated core domain-containing protein n=1 Tax=Sorangium sp. So ce887 TaxID=3133324 RepID=UPI003F5DD33C